MSLPIEAVVKIQLKSRPPPFLDTSEVSKDPKVLKSSKMTHKKAPKRIFLTKYKICQGEPTPW